MSRVTQRREKEVPIKIRANKPPFNRGNRDAAVDKNKRKNQSIEFLAPPSSLSLSRFLCTEKPHSHDFSCLPTIVDDFERPFTANHIGGCDNFVRSNNGQQSFDFSSSSCFMVRFKFWGANVFGRDKNLEEEMRVWESFLFFFFFWKSLEEEDLFGLLPFVFVCDTSFNQINPLSSKFLRIIKKTSCSACNHFIFFNFLKLQAIQSENFSRSRVEERFRGGQSYCRLLRFSSATRIFIAASRKRSRGEKAWVG